MYHSTLVEEPSIESKDDTYVDNSDGDEIDGPMMIKTRTNVLPPPPA